MNLWETYLFRRLPKCRLTLLTFSKRMLSHAGMSRQRSRSWRKATAYIIVFRGGRGLRSILRSSRISRQIAVLGSSAEIEVGLATFEDAHLQDQSLSLLDSDEPSMRLWSIEKRGSFVCRSKRQPKAVAQRQAKPYIKPSHISNAAILRCSRRVVRTSHRGAHHGPPWTSSTNTKKPADLVRS